MAVWSMNYASVIKVKLNWVMATYNDVSYLFLSKTEVGKVQLLIIDFDLEVQKKICLLHIRTST